MSLTFASLSSPLTRRFGRFLGTALAVAAPFALPGCDDNVTCVFFTGCLTNSDPDGSLGTDGSAAVFPENGLWLELGRPVVSSVSPRSTDPASPGSTPIVLTFSESMNASSLEGAFEVAAAGFTIIPLGPVNQALVGDGRMLILFPSTPLTPGDYEIRLVDGMMPIDLTGQALLAADQLLGTFTVDAGPTEATVIGTWPLQSERNASETSEMVVVFDRAIDDSTVSADSFEVKLGAVGGTPPFSDDPAFDPDPSFVSAGGALDARAITYRSVDDDGLPFMLGTARGVSVTVGAPMRDTNGMTVPTQTFDFETAAFAAPLAASFLSAPPDAIGTTNLTFGSGSELMIQVELADGEPEDLVDVILFGTDALSMEDPPTTSAFLRSVQLDGTAPILSASFDLVDLNFFQDDAPGTPRLADGPVAFAFRVRRTGVTSPLTVLDVDSLLPGIQDPVLDTVPPVLEEFLYPAGSADSARSDVRDLVISGRASEPVVAVEIMSDAGDNSMGGMLPEVIGSSLTGDFIAAPVLDSDGILPTDVPFTAIVYDAARNPSPAVSGTFTQLGGVGPGAHTLGDDISVQVYDATTFQLIEGAVVVTHADMGNGTDFPLEDTGTTDMAGHVDIGTAAGMSVGTILTVAADGYDLFTYHDVAASRVSIPLVPTGTSASAMVSGSIVAASEPAAVAFEFGLVDMVLSDSRRPAASQSTYPLTDCDEVGTDCPYGPESILTDRLGAQTFVAGNADAPNEAAYSVTDIVQAFALTVPALPTAPGSSDTTSVDVPFLFTEPGVPSSEQPLDFLPIQMVGAFVQGLDPFMLVGDATTTGDPFVTVESLVPGVPGAVTVGRGNAFPDDMTPGLWTVRAAYAGAASDIGFFGAAGILDPDPFLRVELRDADGNRSGHRPRRSDIPDLPGGILVPANVPLLFNPSAGGTTGGDSWSFTISNAIVDELLVNGFYRITLVDSDGRGWTLWREDTPGMALPVVAVPDLSGTSASALTDGDITVQLSSFAWPDLDTTSFLWSDIEREHSIFAHSAPVTITQD